MNQEMPTMLSQRYASSTLEHKKGLEQAARRINAIGANALNPLQQAAHLYQQQAQKEIIAMSNTRIVKIFVADNNENLPLESRILFSGEEKLTELTDQELFFEVPINDLLTKHNAIRAKTQDKKQAEKFGRGIFLEPARIRDLKMVVVTVAQF